MVALQKLIIQFYQRNLFERIILYIFLADLLVKIIFELVLGQWSYTQSQNKQWIFYGLLALDYAVSWRKIVNIRISMNAMSIFAFVFFTMVAHGLTMGILLHNAPFEIINDTIPMLMIGLNILRMQSEVEFKDINFKFLLYTCTWIAISTCIIGYIAGLIGPSQAGIAGMVIYFPLWMAALLTLKPFPKWIALAGVGMIAITMGDFNRTTLLFLASVAGAGVLWNVIKRPVSGLIALAAATIILSVGIATMPEDSKTYKRIVGIAEIDLNRRTGSIGERQAEWDAINIKLDKLGPSVEAFGLGFGGVYEVARTHEFLTDYGHAHYSWAWYNLRFGRSGYIYLGFLMSALLSNLLYGLIRAPNEPRHMFISLMCYLGLIYCATYVNAIFLLSGIQFFNMRKIGDTKSNEQPTKAEKKEKPDNIPGSIA